MSDYKVNDSGTIRADFVLNVSPSKVSELENDLNYQTKSEVKAIISTVVSSYVHTQSVASDSWVVEHNLNKKPSVTVVDSADNVINPNEIVYNSTNVITVSFLSSFGGKAYLN